MESLRILLIGLFAVGVVLYVLNPGPEKFDRFLQIDQTERAEAAARAETGGPDIHGGMSAFLNNRIGREVEGEATHEFDREQYYVASVYRVDLTPGRAGGRWAYLGVANWFVPVEQPEAEEGP